MLSSLICSVSMLSFMTRTLLSMQVRQICWLAPGANHLSEMHWQAQWERTPVRSYVLLWNILIMETYLTLYWTQHEKHETVYKEVIISASPQHFTILANQGAWLQLLPLTSMLAEQLGKTPPAPSSLLKPWGENPKFEPLRHGSNRQSVKAELPKTTLWWSSQGLTPTRLTWHSLSSFSWHFLLFYLL